MTNLISKLIEPLIHLIIHFKKMFFAELLERGVVGHLLPICGHVRYIHIVELHTCQVLDNSSCIISVIMAYSCPNCANPTTLNEGGSEKNDM